MRFGPFMVIALLLLLLWAGGFLMFHVASGFIHLLLLFAVVSFVVHLVTGSRTAYIFPGHRSRSGANRFQSVSQAASVPGRRRPWGHSDVAKTNQFLQLQE